jgi:hypothetical protein
VFNQALELGCGEAVLLEGGLSELLALGKTAARYQMEDVQSVIEDETLRRLSIESCGCILAAAAHSNLPRLEEAARAFALTNFDKVSATEGFLHLSEDMLVSLLENAGGSLQAHPEGAVLDSVARWVSAGDVAARGEALLLRARPSESALESVAGGSFVGCLEALLLQSVTRRSSDSDPAVPGPASAGPAGEGGAEGVAWERYACGGERRVAAGRVVYSVAVHGEWVLGGLGDGSIRVWAWGTLEPAGTLDGHRDMVLDMAGCGPWVVSASGDQTLRVWDVPARRCVGVLEGHSQWVRAVACLGGGRVASASLDRSVRLWRVPPGPGPGRAERTLTGHEDGVVCLAVCGGRVASGSMDQTIRLWDAAPAGGPAAAPQVLRGHTGGVLALAAAGGGRLLASAGRDRTVRVWSVEGGTCLRWVEACAADGGRVVLRLAVSGARLVGGSFSSVSAGCEVSAGCCRRGLAAADAAWLL